MGSQRGRWEGGKKQGPGPDRPASGHLQSTPEGTILPSPNFIVSFPSTSLCLQCQHRAWHRVDVLQV